MAAGLVLNLMLTSWLTCALTTAAVAPSIRHCGDNTTAAKTIRLADYKPYNLSLLKTDIEFWLDYNLTVVQTNMTVGQYHGGDIVLNGSDFIELDDLFIYYSRTYSNSNYIMKRRLTHSVCRTSQHDLIISEQDIPSSGGSDKTFTISVDTHFNPEENSELFGLYKTRRLLVTQNESAGFRRITYYPDRPDVLSVFTTIMHADANKFPVLLSNGNKERQIMESDGQLTVIYHDPYPKPSYLFALVAGPLIVKEKVVTLGQPCQQALETLVGDGFSSHPLYSYCTDWSVNYEDTLILRESFQSSSKTLDTVRRDDEMGLSFTQSLTQSLKRKLISLPEYVSSLLNEKLGNAAPAKTDSVDDDKQAAFSASDLLSQMETQANCPTHANRAVLDEKETLTGFCPLVSGHNWSGIKSFSFTANTTSIKTCPWHVKTRVWAEVGTIELEQLDWALKSVHAAMLYDEIRFGRYYDLSEFNIVACHDFNAGAMENKGLNIFNEALIIADPQITTDAQYERIQGVIAHEYFHNWSGDRVTLREWFQLTLKEGFTVFRDQSFTTDITRNALLKRLHDIDLIETVQFTEDAGPLSHAIRPEEYRTVENFYSTTVYDKGAEVIRMYNELLGNKLFRKATDRYFYQHIDSATTCEHFLDAVKYVAPTIPYTNGLSWEHFFTWYTTSGTPRIKVTNIHWSSTNQRFQITFEQQLQQYNKHLAELMDVPVTLIIPIRISLIDPVTHQRYADNELVVLSGKQKEYVVHNVHRRPVVSLLRGFSAPVKVESFQSDSDLAYLVMHDDDAYVRFKALDQMLTNEVKQCYIKLSNFSAEECVLNRHLVAVYEYIFEEISLGRLENIFADMLRLPRMDRLKTVFKPFNPYQLTKVIESLKRQVLELFRPIILEKYIELEAIEQAVLISAPESIPDHSAQAVVRRGIKNALLKLLLLDLNELTLDLAVRQLRQGTQANDVIAALFALGEASGTAEIEVVLSDWLRVHKNVPLLVDRWFSAQVSWKHPDCVDRYQHLLNNDLYYHSTTPNRLRALSRSFTSNPVAFHQPKGYELVVSEIIRWDAFNPKLAAGLTSSFNELGLVDDSLKEDGLYELERILEEPGISTNTRDVVLQIKDKLKLAS